MYIQIKRKRRNDSQEKSDIAKLTRIELPGFWRRVLTRQMAKQTQMLPTKFAMTVGPRTAVCTAVDTILGDDAVKLWPEPRDPSKESRMLWFATSLRPLITGAPCLSAAIKLSPYFLQK